MSAKIVGALGEGGAGLWCGGLARYRGGSTAALNMLKKTIRLETVRGLREEWRVKQ